MITIFNGRRRSAGASDQSIYVQMDVSMREHLHLFNNGKNLNAWAIFTAIALHADANGWAWPSFETLYAETGIGQRKTIRTALRHLVKMTIDGSRLIQIYRREDNGEHRGYVYHIFPDAGGGKECPSSLTGEIYVWYPGLDDDDEGGGGDDAPHVGCIKDPTGGGDDAPPKNNHIEVEPVKQHSATRAAESGPADWSGYPSQVVHVPQGGNKSLRAQYTEDCDQCNGTLTQEHDQCPDCGRPVKWEGSVIANAREKQRQGKLADAKAKDRRESIQSISEAANYLLEIATATAPDGKSRFVTGELARIEAFERVYGFEKIKQITEECKAEGDRGRGLILHVINKFASQSFGEEKKRARVEDERY